MYKYHLLFVFLCFGLISTAQTDSTSTDLIKVTGKVVDKYDRPISNLIVINLDTYLGVFGKFDGTYSISVKQDEKLSFRSYGKTSRTVSFVDSLPKKEYVVNITLQDLEIKIDEVTILAPRDLNAIHEDFKELGYDEKDYVLSGVNAMESPITFLYQQFSRKAKDQRLAAELRNEDRKRELLKELFGKYADYGIVDLEDDEFDNFITFMNVPESFLKYSSQYEFVVFVKERFQEYVIYKRRQGLKDEDYEYDQD